MRAAAPITGPKGKPFVGSLFQFRRDPLGFLMRLARDYGDIVYFKLGPEDVFLLNHPDYIRDVLVTNHHNFHKSRGLELAKRLLGEGLLTSEDDFHRRQRRLAQPAFHRQHIASYATVMTEYAVRTRERWREGETHDVGLEMMRLTLAIVAKTLFDAGVEAEANEIGKALTEAMKLFYRITLPFPEILEKLPLPSNRRFRAARHRLDATIYRIINERRRSGADRGDLLSMLLLAQDEEGDGGQMSDLQVRDETMTLFLAGHETTANALTWTWYLLAQHQEVEARMHAEIDRTLDGKQPGFDDVARLSYTEMIIEEAMRFYPPAWVLGRRALSDYRVDKYLIPARSIILMSPYVTHHDARYYPDPFKFDPERWTPEAKAARPKFSYFPFGGGPRVCIGESFAWMEAVLVVATMAQRWRLRLVSREPIKPKPLLTLRPRYPVRMKVERRG